MKTPYLLALASLVLAGVAGTVSAQTIVVQDTFTLNGTARVAGASLNGLTAETDSESSTNTWTTAAGTATNAALFSDTGTIVSNQDITGAGLGKVEMRLGINQPTTTTTIQADVVTASTGWVGIGFANSVGTNTNELTSAGVGQLWVYLSPTGSWAVYTNGASVRLAHGNIGAASGFSSSNAYTIGLTFDPTNQTFTPFIETVGTTTNLILASGTTAIVDANGNSTYTGGAISIPLADQAYDSSIGAIAFRAQQTGSGAATPDFSIDNVVLTNASAIPEPSHVALLFGEE